MLYLDPSLVVSLVTAEAHTAAAQDWLEDQHSSELAISDWVITEVGSALSIKQRTGQIDDVTRARAARAFDDLARDAFSVLPVPRTAFAAAAAMAGRPELVLRSGDALHLATADHHGARLCTRDARQADAGNRLGLNVFLLGDTT
jgi:predicted nucleic acid-binding protein